MSKISDVLIVGYPKSGNTWITRLVAELINCPVSGFLGSDHREIAEEGKERISNFRCLKSHHQLKELQEFDISTKKVIYVLRDPRDIAISGAHYFEIHKYDFLRKICFKTKLTRILYNRIIYPRFIKFRIKVMINAIIYGAKEVQEWLKVSWKNHYLPFLENKYLIVKYEDMLKEPLKECKSILNYIGIQRTEKEIKRAIYNQSFKVKKKLFKQNKKRGDANFLRSGKSKQWEKGLSQKQKDLFTKFLDKELRSNGYHE